jgi:recombination protein RecA
MVKAKEEDTFMSRMVKQYGDAILINKELPEGISTGSVSLDASIGVGGIPREKITEIYGPEGVAKTTLCLTTARSAIKKGYKVLYIDVENMLDHTYAMHIIGGPTPLFEVIQPDTAEDAFTIAEHAIDSGEFVLIIFDSVGALAPKKEKEDEFEDANVALVSRLMSKFLRRNEYRIKTNKIAFLFTNQVRANVGSYSQGYTTPGGHVLKHLDTVIIQLGKGSPIRRGEEQIGAMITFTVKKNKLAPPFRSYTIPIMFGEGIDTLRDFLSFGETTGILSKAGPYIKYGEVNLGRGVADVIQNLSQPENQEIYEEIRNKILDGVNKVKVSAPLTESDE